MTQEEFKAIYEQQTAHERAVLIDRAAAYVTHGDRLGNFFAGAELTEETPLQFAFGLMAKHILALRDLIQKHAEERIPLDDAVMARAREYGGDIRNYVLLILAIFEATRNEQESIRILMEGADEIMRCGCGGGAVAGGACGTQGSHGADPGDAAFGGDAGGDAAGHEPADVPDVPCGGAGDGLSVNQRTVGSEQWMARRAVKNGPA